MKTPPPIPKRAPEDLKSLLDRKSPKELAGLLVELAQDSEHVSVRLARLQLADQPDELAAEFKKTLTSWRRSTRYHGYREAREFGRMLEGWLDQVARELQPKDPRAALSLFESFIGAEAAWFERADDSGGAIGDAVRSACRHWLQAAALCPRPRGGWSERLLKLFQAEDYGAREELLRRAHLLLDEPARRALVSRLETSLAHAVESSAGAKDPSSEVFRSSGALSLLAESLRDPDIKVRATLRYSPKPNAMQRQAFVGAYLDADRPADALIWLQDDWGHLDDTREGLLAEVLEHLGRFEESLPIRQRTFARTLSPFDYQKWLEHLPQDAHADAAAQARQLALHHDQPVASVTLLLRLGDAEAAEARLLTNPAGVEGGYYADLIPIAKALRSEQRLRGETVVQRALLKGILERGYSPAYDHAARYWARLTEIAGSGIDLSPLPSHQAFEAEIRARHGRKTSFWAYVNGSRQIRQDDEDDDLPR